MVFSTLIAMVPFMAFITILLGDLKIIDTVQLREMINENIAKKILPANQQLITDYINDFTENAATLGWIGLIIFLISSIFLIKKINDTFNLIYKTTPRKGMMARLATYVTGMVIGTLFLGITVAATAPLQELMAQNEILDTGNALYRFMTELAPWLFIFIGLLIIFKKVPSARVKWSSAFFASLFATIVWQLANLIFSQAIDKMFTYQRIYGPLATAIIFLIWVNIMWVVIYLSLEIAYVHQYRSHAFKEVNRETGNPFNRFANAFNIMHKIVNGFSTGERAVTAQSINRSLSIPESELRDQLTRLERTGLILRTADRPPRFVPARSLDQTKIEEILALTYGLSSEGGKEPSYGRAQAGQILQAARSAYRGHTLSDMVEKATEKDEV